MTRRRLRPTERSALLRSISLDVLVLVLDGALERAYTNASEWSGLGYPTRSYGDITVTSGGTSDPVVDLVASAQRDHFAHEIADADGRLRDVAENVRVLASFALRNTLEAPRPKGGGLIDCGNSHCDRYVTGLGSDRLRDGRCPRCYMHRRRYGLDWPGKATVTKP